MPTPATSKRTQDLVRQLSGRLRQFEKSIRPNNRLRVSSGCEPLDRLLPGRGLAQGSLVEWLAAVPAGGATTLALLAARQACREGGALVVVDRQNVFYPPAAAAWGIDLQRMIVVRPATDNDEFWAMDQILRCPHVAAMLAWPKRLDSLWQRRMQLAVESGGGLGLLVRGPAARVEPSWADIRLLVSPSVVRRSTADMPLGSRAPTKLCTGLSTSQTALCASLLTPHKRLTAGLEGEQAARAALSAGPKLWPASDPCRTQSQHSWRLRVQLVRCRGHFGGKTVELQIDQQTGMIHETHPGDPAAELARAASDQHSAGA